MVLRPKDVLPGWDGEIDAKQLEGFEKFIDLELQRRFQGTAVEVDLDSANYSTFLKQPRLKELLQEKYEAAGWYVRWNIGDDQRDGTWCKVTLSPKRGER